MQAATGAAVSFPARRHRGPDGCQEAAALVACTGCMPAHISHLLFAEDVLREATGDAERLLEEAGNLFRLGAQGPDLFYHNQRTRPLALRYGSLIHRRGFGTLVAHMARTIIAGAQRSGRIDVEQVAFLAGFATHADLDRHAHPYIICRAGWVRHGQPSTQRYRRCHALLERLLDVVALRARRGRELAEFEFLANVTCGEGLPYGTLKMLVKGIDNAFPTASYKSRNRRRIENAYTDSMRFYTLTDHRNRRLRERALAVDRREGYRHRHSAVFHFAAAGADLDPGNLRRRPWPHPCDPTVMSDHSYVDLMAEAQQDVVPKLRRLLDLLGWPGGAGRPARAVAAGPAHDSGWFAELAELFGNQGLGATLDGESCAPVHCQPLPLPELFERLHEEPGTRSAVRPAGPVAP